VSPRQIRVGLIDTAQRDQPGSMRAYADTLQQALQRHAPEIDAELLPLANSAASGRWTRRVESMAMLARAWGLRSRVPDLWHVLDGSRAYVAVGLSERPVVITAHDVIPVLQSRGCFAGAPSVGWAARQLWRANARSTRGAAAVVCDSVATRSDVGATMHVANQQVRVVPLPLRPGLADQLADGARGQIAGQVLHVGNNGFYKNRQQVLRIFAAMNPQLARELVMLGPPPSGDLMRLADQLKLGERLRWVKDPGDGEVAQWYRSASVLVFPSLYEGFGWPVLEAMAFGLPVLAANSGSLPEVVGSVSECFDPEDIASFVAAAERLLHSHAAWNQASVAGIERASGFSEQQFACRMRDVYRDVAALGQGHRMVRV